MTRRLLLPLLFCAVALTAPAQIIESYNASPNLAVPDGSPVGVVSTIQVSGSSILQITSIQVNLNVSGGFNGDYYAYLVHYTPEGNPAGIVTLLNRTGSTAGNPFGYNNPGFNVTFSDGAANGDIHLYQNVINPGAAALTGSWQPDGRAESPFSAIDTSPRTETLAGFNGFSAAGSWSLYLADVSSLGTGTFVTWGLTIQGVPEPGTWAVGGLAVALLARRVRRGS